MKLSQTQLGLPPHKKAAPSRGCFHHFLKQLRMTDGEEGFELSIPFETSIPSSRMATHAH